MSRLNNLKAAITESTGGLGGIAFSALSCAAYAGLFLVYDRTLTSSAISLSVFGFTLLSVCVVYVNALSHGGNSEERQASVRRFSVLTFALFNSGLLLSTAAYLGGDVAVRYFVNNPEHLVIAAASTAFITAMVLFSSFHFVFARLKHQELGSVANSTREEIIERIEVTEARTPTMSLRYSEKDRKRKAAHFAGRVMCFAGSPYLDNDFDFEVNEEFAQISYRGDHSYEDEDFLYWMVFQLLSAQQAEVAFAKKASKISWEHYGDIEHYVSELLAARPGGSRILRDPQNAPEVDWRSKRIRFFVKETIPKVHAFLRQNSDQLKRITKATLSGTLTPLELRAILRSIDTAYLPAHWDESKSGRNHLTLVN
ncbi:hypothetical protein [Marinobacter sp.]|uniref:hypothetical protein n=1 Tax=Marinobacter sp. TaxID=50741 RepID=UPI00260AE325|nr:hypothetical protein [Marinobacter sp.]